MAYTVATGGGFWEMANGGGTDGAGARVRVTEPEPSGTLSGPGPEDGWRGETASEEEAFVPPPPCENRMDKLGDDERIKDRLAKRCP